MKYIVVVSFRSTPPQVFGYEDIAEAEWMYDSAFGDMISLHQKDEFELLTEVKTRKSPDLLKG